MGPESEIKPNGWREYFPPGTKTLTAFHPMAGLCRSVGESQPKKMECRPPLSPQPRETPHGLAKSRRDGDHEGRGFPRLFTNIPRFSPIEPPPRFPSAPSSWRSERGFGDPRLSLVRLRRMGRFPVFYYYFPNFWPHPSRPRECRDGLIRRVAC